MSQYVEVDQAQTGLVPEVGVELTHEAGMRVEQSPPRPLSAPARQRLLNKPAEESSYITQRGMYLHVQQVTTGGTCNRKYMPREEDSLMTQVQPDLDRTLRRRFAAPAEDARVSRTAAVLEGNGITVVRAPNRAEAKRIVLVGSQRQSRTGGHTL